MNETELSAYLRAHIPLSAGLDVTVRKANATAVTLEAPPSPNINRETVCGGSASAAPSSPPGRCCSCGCWTRGSTPAW